MYYFPELSKYGGFTKHPNYRKLGRFWSWTYLFRNFFSKSFNNYFLVLWITWRVSVMLYRRIKDQINGKEDLLYSLYYDWQYDDWHRDIEDMKMVNFRYNDHRDRDPSVSFWTHEIYKPEAEKAKSALKFYRYGNDSKLKWFFNKYF